LHTEVGDTTRNETTIQGLTSRDRFRFQF